MNPLSLRKLAMSPPFSAPTRDQISKRSHYGDKFVLIAVQGSGCETMKTVTSGGTKL